MTTAVPRRLRLAIATVDPNRLIDPTAAPPTTAPFLRPCCATGDAAYLAQRTGLGQLAVIQHAALPRQYSFVAQLRLRRPATRVP